MASAALSDGFQRSWSMATNVSFVRLALARQFLHALFVDPQNFLADAPAVHKVVVSIGTSVGERNLRRPIDRLVHRRPNRQQHIVPISGLGFDIQDGASCGCLFEAEATDLSNEMLIRERDRRSFPNARPVV